MLMIPAGSGSARPWSVAGARSASFTPGVATGYPPCASGHTSRLDSRVKSSSPGASSLTEASACSQVRIRPDSIVASPRMPVMAAIDQKSRRGAASAEESLGSRAHALLSRLERGSPGSSQAGRELWLLRPRSPRAAPTPAPRGSSSGSWPRESMASGSTSPCGAWLPGARFPDAGEAYRARLESLARLVERAARRGVAVWLYLNEPRARPASFFERRPAQPGRASAASARPPRCSSGPRWSSRAGPFTTSSTSSSSTARRSPRPTSMASS